VLTRTTLGNLIETDTEQNDLAYVLQVSLLLIVMPPQFGLSPRH